MVVNSIADVAPEFKQSVFKSPAQLNQTVKDKATSTEDMPETSEAPLGVPEKSPVRRMDHISDSYDAKGNIITKYMDSSNKVIYQTPSDSVLRAQELMSKVQTATSTKA